MEKIRIYELARDLNMENKILLEKIGEMDIPVKSHMSSLDDEAVAIIRADGKLEYVPVELGSKCSMLPLHLNDILVRRTGGGGGYGDPLDPLGTKKAAAELSRCLAKGGNLFFSVAAGKPKLCFNAHRIHSPKQILEYFSDLKLVELAGSDDNKRFIENIDIDLLENARYACGMFWFTKE